MFWTVLTAILSETTSSAITGDYHLQSGSPAIDAGTSTGVPATDFGGNARPLFNSVWDIGAYEFGATGTVPNPPAGLTAIAH